jgi:hypothetical protein
VEFGRRTRVTLFHVNVEIASLEDVLISKLEWSRLGDPELQRRDVLQLLERRWSELDHAYIERWVAELGIQADWEEALPRAGRE